MSTPLNVAVDIVRAVWETSRQKAVLDIDLCAKELSLRHSGAGYSSVEIASALRDEAAAAGVLGAGRSTRRD